mgnify:CR=1 FL=1
MITIQNPLTFTSSYSAQTVRSYLRSAFFRYRDNRLFRRLRSVYLIGCVWHDGNTWILTQYFAETRMQRKRFSTLFLHFSGQSASSSISTATGLTFHF